MFKSLIHRFAGLLSLAAVLSISGSPASAQQKAYRGSPAETAATQQARPFSHYMKARDNSGLNSISAAPARMGSRTFSASSAAAAASRVTIGGYVTGTGNLPVGIYSFDAGPNPQLTLLFHDDEARLAADGGGTYYDGKYYYVEWHYGLMSDEIYAHYGIQETENWTELYRSAMDQNPIDEHSIALDLTYCPADKTIYGVFEDYDVIADTYNYYFGRLNQYGEREGIAQIDRRYWAIASDAAGNIFAVDEEGWLCSFDRSSGDRKSVV